MNKRAFNFKFNKIDNMRKPLLAFMLIVIVLLLISTLYLYSQFPGFKMNMSSDYKLGFNIEPRKVISEHECAEAVNKDYKERLARYCNEQGFDIAAEEIGDDYNLGDCIVPEEMIATPDREYQIKAEFCGYLF